MLIKIKSVIRDTITCAPLTGIMGFIIGAYTVFLIEFFCFDNHISIEGVNTIISGMALLFTVYAALKVKKWSETKTNEKGFKRCEEIVDQIAKIKHKLVEIYPFFYITKKENITKFITNEDYLSKKSDESENIALKCEEILKDIEIALSLQNQLNTWGMDCKDEFYAFELTKTIIDMEHSIDIFYDYLNKNINSNHDTFIQQFALSELYYFDALLFCNKFATTKFDDIFIAYTPKNQKNKE